MRNELEQIERVVAYLSDNMSSSEKFQFEKELETNSSLSEELNMQQKLMNGVKRQHLRTEIRAAEKTYNRIRLGKQALIATILAMITITLGIYAYRYYQNSQNKSIESVPSTESTLNENLPIQEFKLDNRKDTIVVTSSGIVFAIGEGSFDTKQPYVTLQIQEALHPDQIIKAGLSTISNGKLLETGGMFFIQAIVDGVGVQLRKPIIAEVPDITGKSGMQIFDGVADSSGIINWTNPQPTETFLQTYPVTSLDFYPPQYLSQLEILQQDYQNKSFTDSLYYSFSTTKVSHSVKPKNVESNYNSSADTINYEYESNENYIAPAKIKTIWNDRFNQTLVATKEFEARLKVYHEQCEAGKLFDLVMNNLDKPFREIDRMALEISRTSEIEAFLTEDKGRVRPDTGLFRSLNAFYAKQWKVLDKEAQNARRAYLTDPQLKNEKFDRMVWDIHQKADSVNTFLFLKELRFNLDTAYKQLGYPVSANPILPRLTVSITSTGWKNLDQYVLESTAKRESMSYTDPETGKTAVLKYAKALVIVEQAEQYDQLRVYAIPKKFNSYVRMKNLGSGFEYSLNEMMEYSLFATATIGNQEYLYQSAILTSGETHIVMLPASKEAMNDAFATLSRENSMSAFETEKTLLRLTIEHAQSSAKFTLSEKLRRAIKPYVFQSCIEEPTETEEA